ncbi:hypothetical protein CBW65_02075 [Tumebacillus avium]|uniref:Uncharacterized protein n=1 Tax=Tumebacillus avium TaxID=1903704 RepID=A0A1Y0IHK6_9BACL|nr:hypothetical protein [Tumebacillus avium]ARU59982.1 hypothetical protein CBW65_02075 [Tumebacillus avium]
MSELEFASVASSALQLLAEAVEQETTRRGASERQSESMHAGLVASWLEQFAGGPLWERRKELGLQLRAELMELLGGMEPQLATALLCVLPGAERRGYTAERLAVSLGVAVGQIAAWEGEAYTRLGELVSEWTPLLAFLKGQAGAGARGRAGQQMDSGDASEADRSVDGSSLAVVRQKTLVSSEDGRSVEAAPLAVLPDKEALLSALSAEAVEALLQSAGAEADFDLRNYVAASLELRIRQAFHRFGVAASEQVESLFSESERVAVALVSARMTLEMGGEEEQADG